MVSRSDSRSLSPKQALPCWWIGSDVSKDTLWLCQNSYQKWQFIVDVPMKHSDFPVRYVSHYQRVWEGTSTAASPDLPALAPWPVLKLSTPGAASKALGRSACSWPFAKACCSWVTEIPSGGLMVADTRVPAKNAQAMCSKWSKRPSDMRQKMRIFRGDLILGCHV